MHESFKAFSRHIYFIGILDYRHFSKVDSFSGFTVIIADAMNIVDNGN